MDEELRAYLDAMMGQINDQFERVLEKLTTVGADLQNSNAWADLGDDPLGDWHGRNA